MTPAIIIFLVASLVLALGGATNWGSREEGAKGFSCLIWLVAFGCDCVALAIFLYQHLLWIR